MNVLLMIAHVALTCDPALTRLFTPLHPQRGQYEVCTTPDAIEEVAADGVNYGPVEPLLPSEAFGAAGPYDRSAVARLYGGKRASVARGWRRAGERFESVTLVSPYPDASLTRLIPGTMVIRWTCDMQQAECRVAAGATRP